MPRPADPTLRLWMLPVPCVTCGGNCGQCAFSGTHNRDNTELLSGDDGHVYRYSMVWQGTRWVRVAQRAKDFR